MANEVKEALRKSSILIWIPTIPNNMGFEPTGGAMKKFSLSIALVLLIRIFSLPIDSEAADRVNMAYVSDSPSSSVPFRPFLGGQRGRAISETWTGCGFTLYQR